MLNKYNQIRLLTTPVVLASIIISLSACQTMPTNMNTNSNNVNNSHMAMLPAQNQSVSSTVSTVATPYQPDMTQTESISQQQSKDTNLDIITIDTADTTPTPTQNQPAPHTSIEQEAQQKLETNQQEQQRLQQQHRQQLLQRARHNSNEAGGLTQPTSATPVAYNQLMKQGIQQLKTNQLGEAEATFTRAQRLAPKASAAYFYLGQIALIKNQPAKAEAMARRGLLVATTQDNKQGLWLIILKSAKMRQNDQLIHEAQRALR